MLRHIPRLPALLLLLGLPLLGATGAVAQSEEAQRADTFGETIEVNVINVLATVTDRNGVPVHGLTKDDFEVLEDGVPMEITNFYAVRRDQVVESVTAEIEERGPGGPPMPSSSACRW